MRVRYTLPALADLDHIVDYIAARSPQAAERIRIRIQAVIDLLRVYPGIGVRTEDQTIRRINTTPYPYLIFYEIHEQEIIIHAIRHGARGPVQHARCVVKSVSRNFAPARAVKRRNTLRYSALLGASLTATA
jgi:plasmid stabilization system protein ParE